MKPFEIKGKYGWDKLIIKKCKKNIQITASIDGCGADFIIPREELI